MNSKRIRIWDLPTRVFHWLLAILVVAAIVTAEVGGNLIEWHGRIGILMAGLLAFRIVWGFVGSTYARFRQFFPTPGKISAYLRGTWQGGGHNPLGALSVFGLITVLCFQVLTGLVANDDIAFSGPLADLVGRDWSNRLSGLHHLLADVLIPLIVLHVAAIVFYARIKKKNLVRPMITGWQEEGHGQGATGGGRLALILALVVALAAIYGASGAWLPTPATPPVLDTPSW